MQTFVLYSNKSKSYVAEWETTQEENIYHIN